ncbi:MAG: hypothetical protein AAB692_04480 [Patescibacteria group bacterium]
MPRFSFSVEVSSVPYFTESTRFLLVDVARGVDILKDMLHRFLGAPQPVPPPSPAPAVTPTVTQSNLEFLPPGVGPTVQPTVAPGARRQRPWGAKLPLRLQFLGQLGPLGVIAGARVDPNGRKYFAFVFPDVVVLESEDYAMSAYTFRNQPGWEALAVMAKSQLIRNKPAGFIRRYKHEGDWQSRITTLVQTGQP